MLLVRQVSVVKWVVPLCLLPIVVCGGRNFFHSWRLLLWDLCILHKVSNGLGPCSALPTYFCELQSCRGSVTRCDIFTARCYARVVYAVIVCLSVCLSIRLTVRPSQVSVLQAQILNEFITHWLVQAKHRSQRRLLLGVISKHTGKNVHV